MCVPNAPKLYHITHVDNLFGIVRDGLLSDAEIQAREGDNTSIGMSKIKRRRLERYTVEPYPNTYVGEYVPFYFCPRSVMLYILHKGNHQAIDYQEGQEPIVHLQLDISDVAQWADSNGVNWAFTHSNAGARYCTYESDLDCLSKLDWDAIKAQDWRKCKDRKQAEFLVHEHVPWHLIEKIGVFSKQLLRAVEDVVDDGAVCPPVAVEKAWYY